MDAASPLDSRRPHDPPRVRQRDFGREDGEEEGVGMMAGGGGGGGRCGCYESGCVSPRTPTFHLNELDPARRLPPPPNRDEEDFAGTRDLIATCCGEADSFDDRCIKSSKGTVRGVRNRVKVGVVTFHEQTWTNVRRMKMVPMGR